MKNIILSLAVAILIVSGCAIKTHYIQSNKTPMESVSPEQVKVYVKAPEGRKYNVIGSVASYAAGAEDAISELKKEAGSIGANAIINLKLHKEMSYSEENTGASGVAVRMQEDNSENKSGDNP